jgi:glycosyltransferase involved in cell wall biosynthesis
VRLLGFKQQEELPQYYALADLFVFPTHIDPWGLVVNEAMSCGLPVLCSTAAGAAFDLIRPGVNGYTFDPTNVTVIKELLVEMLSDPDKAAAMGRQSQTLIASHTPEKCAEGMAQAILSARERRNA